MTEFTVQLGQTRLGTGSLGNGRSPAHYSGNRFILWHLRIVPRPFC